MSRVNITPITETQTVQVGQTFTVTLSEREVALLTYLLGRTPFSLLGFDATLYESLAAAIGEDTRDWGDPSSIVPDGNTSWMDEVTSRLDDFSDRLE